MQDYEKPVFIETLLATSEILGRRLSAAAVDNYFDTMKEFPLTPVLLALKDAQKEEERMPVPARIITRLKNKYLTTSRRADEPNTEWLREKIQSSRCVCGADKQHRDPFCLSCWQIVERDKWSNGLTKIESYFLGACASLRGAEIPILDPDIKPGLRMDSAW